MVRNEYELRAYRRMKKRFSVGTLPQGAESVKLLGIDYAHLKTNDGGDLYVTKHGLPFLSQVMPENWYEKEWFKAHRERLKGTSTVYKVRTKKIGGRALDLVIKWSRFGQDVPLETRTIEALLGAEFNTPFEEFALLEEMRIGEYGPQDVRMLTHRPLAIYVPPERLQFWQTGRSRYKINMKVRNHPGVEIDILRQYILIYEWIGGIDAAEAYEQLRIPQEKLHALTWKVIADLRLKGFQVADMKPAHIIIRKRNDGTVVTRNGEVVYALVDFELLCRTPEHEQEIQRMKRADYLARQRERFSEEWPELPSYLKPMNIFGVDYIYGRVESTGGALWVVGRDPQLFDYFQPERWRKAQQRRLSESHHVYYTHTKDNIHLVWKTSRVGELPPTELNDERNRRMMEHGYNSPFEEFAYALELNRRGIPVTFPRAIYMTGPESENNGCIADFRRHRSHSSILTPEGQPILRTDHDYVKIWGYWNGPNSTENGADATHQSLSLLEAGQQGLMAEETVQQLIRRMQLHLEAVGFESINLASHHLLLTLDEHNRIVYDEEGCPETRLCNFEMIRRLD